MTRRQSIRQATLFGIGMALGRLDALKADGGHLTVDLGQWHGVIFILNGKKINVSGAEIFRALQEVGVGGVK